jgi:hypothetical protein
MQKPISQEHKKKLFTIWKRGLKNKNREALLQVASLIEALSEDGRDLDFERHLLNVRRNHAENDAWNIASTVAPRFDFENALNDTLLSYIGDAKIYENTINHLIVDMQSLIGKQQKQILSLLDYAFDVIQEGSDGGFVF